MTYDPTPAFMQLEASFSNWVETAAGFAKAEVNQNQLEDPLSDVPQVGFLALGWRQAMANGRQAKEQRVIADYLITASAKTSAVVHGIIGALLVQKADVMENLSPVSSDDTIWQTLGVAPRPALLASCIVDLTRKEVLATPISEVRATYRPSAAISGQVLQKDKPVAEATVSIAGSDHAVMTDIDGHFVLYGWTGQPLAVAYRGSIQVFKPKPGSDDLVISIQKEH